MWNGQNWGIFFKLSPLPEIREKGTIGDAWTLGTARPAFGEKRN
jgi:hypothetical protein